MVRTFKSFRKVCAEVANVIFEGSPQLYDINVL